MNWTELKRDMKEYAAELGLSCVGVSGAQKSSELESLLLKAGKCAFVHSPPEERSDPQAFLPGAQSVIVCLFPYGSRAEKGGNLSRYAQVLDYHTVARPYLERIAGYLAGRVPQIEYKIHVDSGPLAERHLAYQAGLGFFGKNHCLIHPDLGTYFFIGCLVCSLPLPPDEPMHGGCMDCGKCIAACPGGVLDEMGGFDSLRCVSTLTQEKEITQSQRELLKQEGTVFGCDVCQEVCPHNEKRQFEPLPEFRKERIEKLDLMEVSTLSNKAFLRKYGKYPFAWRGKSVFRKYFEK